MFMNKVIFTWTYKPLTLCATHLGFNPFNVIIPKVAIPNVCIKLNPKSV